MGSDPDEYQNKLERHHEDVEAPGRVTRSTLTSPSTDGLTEVAREKRHASRGRVARGRHRLGRLPALVAEKPAGHGVRLEAQSQLGERTGPMSSRWSSPDAPVRVVAT